MWCSPRDSAPAGGVCARNRRGPGLGVAEPVELAYAEVERPGAGAVGRVSSGVRSGELFAALSLATDLGTGQPSEHGLRTCLLATELATLAGLEGEELEDAFYLGLLHSIGCTADAPVTARAFGDNVAHKAAFTLIDSGRPVEIVTYLWRNVYPTAPPPRRLRAFVAAVAAGPGFARVNLRSHCEVGERLGERLRLPPRVSAGLWFVFERWDGKGMPNGIAGRGDPDRGADSPCRPRYVGVRGCRRPADGGGDGGPVRGREPRPVAGRAAG